jgi:hypothetical protein
MSKQSHEPIRTIGVKFGVSEFDKVYSYKLYAPLVGLVKLGDLVAVQARGVVGIAEVVRLDAADKPNAHATAWAFQKLDLELHRKLLKDQKPPTNTVVKRDHGGEVAF